MKKTLFTLLAALLAFSFAQETSTQEANPEETVDPIVISVNGAEESLTNFNNRFEIAINSLAAAQGLQVDDALRQQLEPFKPQFLERRVTELVLLQEAVARGMSVDQTEVDAQVTEIKEGLPEGISFEVFLQGGGFSAEAQLREYITESSLLQIIVDTLQSEIVVSEETLANAYESRQADFATEEEVCARHILLDTVEDANDVLSELEGGADFAALAVERSTGPSGPTGGDLGCFGLGMMVAPFEEAVFAAEVDTPVGPVETQFGFHVILAYQKTEAGVASLEDVREELEQDLKAEQFNVVLDGLMASATVETFPELLVAAENTSEEEIVLDLVQLNNEAYFITDNSNLDPIQWLDEQVVKYNVDKDKVIAFFIEHYYEVDRLNDPFLPNTTTRSPNVFSRVAESIIAIKYDLTFDELVDLKVKGLENQWY